MTTKSKMPQIRFNGFRGEWEKKELIDICDFINENISLSKLASDKYISTENLLQDFLGVILSSKLPNLKNVTHFKKNDILISNIRPYLKKVWSATFDGGASNDVIVVRANENINNNYLTHLIKNEKFINYVMEGAKGVKMPRGDISLIKKYPLVISTNAEEQTKISDYFQHLDKLIEQKEKKYQKLRQFKKAMLDKMFPKNGSTTPEIRFKGFSGEWEEKKFGELAEVRRGLTYKPTDVNDNGVKVLRSSNILDDTFVNNKDDVYVNEEAINIKYVAEYDILITSANGSSRLVGKHAIIQNLHTKTVHGGFMLLVSSKNPFFLNSSMSSSWYNKFINKYVSGGNGAIGNLSKNDLEEQYIYVPFEINEQIKIGDYFHNLDKLIDLHQQELKKLKNIKKASLEKMFV